MMRSQILLLVVCIFGLDSLFGQNDPEKDIRRWGAAQQFDSVVVWYHTISKNDSLLWLSPQAVHRTAKALFYCGYNREAIRLYRTLTGRIPDDTAMMMSVLLDYALVLTESGDYFLADSVFRRAAVMLQEAGTQTHHGNYFNRLAVLRLRQSRYAEAGQLLDSALTCAWAINDSALCSAVYTHIGMVARETGFYGKALEAYRQAWILDSLRGRTYDIAVVAMNIANVYNELGQFRKSLPYYEKAKSCYLHLRDTSGLAMVAANQATAYYDLGDHLNAMQACEQARMLDRGEDPLGLAGILLNLGVLHMQLRRFPESFHWLDSAARLYRQLNRPVEEAYARCFSGRGRTLIGWYADAGKEFQKALWLIARTETPEAGWIVYYEYATMYYRLGQKNRALSLLDTALQYIEKIQIKSGDESLFSHYLENEFHQAYRLYAQILIEKKMLAKALRVTEKIRARSIQWSGDSDLCTALAQPIFRYFYYDSLWYVFIVRPDTVTIRPLQAGASLAHLCTDYYRLLIKGINDHRLKKISRQLFDCLVRPLQNELQPEQPFIIVPDGYLYYIPFETLSDEHGYLIERYPVRYLPSVKSETVFCQRRRALQHQKLNSYLYFRSDYRLVRDERYGEDLPDLPAADKERISIRRHFYGDSVNFVTNQVSEHTVASLSGQPLDVLHIASHAVHNILYPDHSALVLGCGGQVNEDGYLTVEEIHRLSFPVRLVVLSACETSLGELLAGEGMNGLTRAFLVTGAASVISTLWKIEDDSAAHLMERFYFYHKSLHLPAATALQKAKIECLRSDSFRSLQWAAFVLWGADE